MKAETFYEMYVKMLPQQEQQRFCSMLEKKEQPPAQQTHKKTYGTRHLILTMPKRKAKVPT
jgi:hypothetical protein